jgi:hypothetical protein
MADTTLTVESDWLPSVELRRLLQQAGAGSAGSSRPLTISPESADHRGLDPAMAAALISGAITLLSPFVAKLVERIFTAEPEATVALSDDAGNEHATLLASLPEDVRTRLVNEAIAAGALRVRISLEPAP